MFVEFKLGLKPTATYQQLISIIGDEKCLAYQLFNAGARNGLLGCNGDPQNAGRKSIEGRTDTVVQMIENDRTLSIGDIEMLSGIPKSSVSRI